MPPYCPIYRPYRNTTTAAALSVNNFQLFMWKTLQSGGFIYKNLIHNMANLYSLVGFQLFKVVSSNVFIDFVV